MVKNAIEKYKELQEKEKGNVFQLPVAQELDGGCCIIQC